ncbi:hypothetical protein NEUTE1DRAFT_107400 [Neurospora tetrasperma FGSC 2508]|uniref:Uncharacterized protein n=1 Tax=Neurospora tetrasperma (strain FGSC 2508 / ATCC MYA-4615 / P0657) TaxID=510951 RepID=F8MEI8_NEUT8|nr:uncharacterized protein NEUTE1DRAFT_107400 [Neurospora tetrasperma FGSC 2508]EGO60819.1 hypothetical protein NEUTE1DRAFT_107400 [Neurospora tetrasperma FGSC 2508]EGZ75191.1 hypothetical protein NEUTE2DRAFT_136364 [Neurospora tetrasperma FGSC 2509]
MDSFAISDLEVQFYYLLACLLSFIKKLFVAFAAYGLQSPSKLFSKFRELNSWFNAAKKQQFLERIDIPKRRRRRRRFGLSKVRRRVVNVIFPIKMRLLLSPDREQFG